MILEGTVVQEPPVAEQEYQKFGKSQKLAAYFTTQHSGWRVKVALSICSVIINTVVGNGPRIKTFEQVRLGYFKTNT